MKNATLPERLLPEQIHEIVQELRTVDYAKEGHDLFTSRLEQLEARGWVIGIEAYRHKVFKDRRGRLLKHPRYEWRNLAHFYNAEQKVKVWFWNNGAFSKTGALAHAKATPPPAGNYITFNLNTTHSNL